MKIEKNTFQRCGHKQRGWSPLRRRYTAYEYDIFITESVNAYLLFSCFRFGFVTILGTGHFSFVLLLKQNLTLHRSPQWGTAD